MTETIEIAAQQLLELSGQLSENDSAVEALTEREDAEELLIGMGMADAYLQGAITINPTGEKHIRTTLVEVQALFEGLDDDEADDE